MCTASLNACWDFATTRYHWTEQRHHQVGRRPLYQTEPNLSTFPEGDLINDDSSLCSQILITIIDLQCHVFVPFGKLLFNVLFVCKRYFWWRQIHVVLLQCWAKFSNFLVRRRIKIVHAKNLLRLNLLKLYLEYCRLFFSGHGLECVSVYTSICDVSRVPPTIIRLPDDGTATLRQSVTSPLYRRRSFVSLPVSGRVCVNLWTAICELHLSYCCLCLHYVILSPTCWLSSDIEISNYKIVNSVLFQES